MGVDSPVSAPLILLLLNGTQPELRLLVHPDFRSIVLPEDFEFIEPLIRDFAVRARLHPADLFKHLSTLEHGPLITQQVGENLPEFPELEKQCAQFVPI